MRSSAESKETIKIMTLAGQIRAFREHRAFSQQKTNGQFPNNIVNALDMSDDDGFLCVRCREDAQWPGDTSESTAAFSMTET